jgi:hypothetical protein
MNMMNKNPASHGFTNASHAQISASTTFFSPVVICAMFGAERFERVCSGRCLRPIS